MNKLLIALAAGAAIAAAGPAFADDSLAGDKVISGKRVGVDARIASLETRFHDGIASGRIGTSEAPVLREKLVKLGELAATYKSDGLTAQEQAALRRQIEFARADLQKVDGGGSGYAAWRDTTRLGLSR